MPGWPPSRCCACWAGAGCRRWACPPSSTRCRAACCATSFPAFASGWTTPSTAAATSASPIWAGASRRAPRCRCKAWGTPRCASTATSTATCSARPACRRACAASTARWMRCSARACWTSAARCASAAPPRCAASWACTWPIWRRRAPPHAAASMRRGPPQALARRRSARRCRRSPPDRQPQPGHPGGPPVRLPHRPACGGRAASPAGVCWITTSTPGSPAAPRSSPRPTVTSPRWARSGPPPRCRSSIHR